MATVKYLEKWFENKNNQKSLKLLDKLYVEGLFDKHLGPMMSYAKVNVLIEPADRFLVEYDLGIDINDEITELLSYAIFGIIDIFLNLEPYPLKNVKVILEKYELDPINSSLMSFRNAGRNVGEQVKEKLAQDKQLWTIEGL